ncbi:MAG: SpvB/TcaC N-terminal domain-containing protein [Nitrospira sp.]
MTPSPGGQPTEPVPSRQPGVRAAGSSGNSSANSFQITPPSVSLPKGGGAVRGIGEKFAANPVTGTGSMSVSIATSPGRSGFGPQLSLSYDSGAGNGPFGLGWSLSLPSITRKTDKGLPKYQDTDESDVFILSGAEDLVPVLNPDGSRHKDTTTVPGYEIRRYCPRVEGLFARIERWTNSSDPQDIFWRSISRDNVTTWYGKTTQSRIADPSDPLQSFSWLICESCDDRGNAIVYEYKAEDSAGVETSQANERKRERTANRYLKRIKYGNRVSRLVQQDLTQASWMFEVVFDYGDHDPDVPLRDEPGKQWTVRQDPFSSYRAGFEVRTYRLCQRVLMFHHFSELGVTPCLVRSTDLHHAQGPIASFLTSVTQSGYKRKNDGTYRKKSLPPVEFTYREANIQEEVHEADPASLENLPQGLDNSRYQWADLDGEGRSGILTEQGGAWFYKRNQSAVPVRDPAGNETTRVRFAPLECVATMPSSANLSGGQQLLDLAGDGRLDVVDFEGPAPGFYKRTSEEEWQTHRPFASIPNIAWHDPNLKFIDLTGDGHADILITDDQAFSWYQSMAEAGFGQAENVRQAMDEEQGPRLVFADGTQSIYLADLSGDGLTDLVRIRNGEVCYWPNLGYGRFGAKVTMDHAPWFDAPDLFDQRRIRLADIDGSGLVDILYLTGQGVQLYFNQAGNAWSERRLLTTFPRIDNLSSVSTVDLLGNGTACLVWSSPLPGEARSTIRYIDLMGGQKPHLLTSSKNNLGGETIVTYAPSTKFYLQDKQAGKPWITKLPFPVHCVERVTVCDTWRQTEFSSTYSYHHGYFDGIEREFRGFGRVEQVDVETYGKFMQGNAASPYITGDHDLYQPPIKTVTWYHTGAAFDRHRILSAFKNEYYPIPGFTEHQLPEPTLTPTELSAEEWREALRACKGMVLRQEVFEVDVDALVQEKEVPVRLYTTAYHNSAITRLQPQGINRHAVFLVTESEAIIYNYELDLRQTVPNPDPRIAHTLNLKIDEMGNVLESVAAVYPRIGRHTDRSLSDEQRALIDQVQKGERHLALNCTSFTEDINDPNTYRLRMPCQTQTWEVTGIQPSGTYFTLAELKQRSLTGSGVGEIAYHRQPNSTPQKRLVECVRTLFFADDLIHHRPYGEHGPLGLPYESYKLALTNDLIASVYGDQERIDAAVSALDEQVSGFPVSGYYKGDALFAGYPITLESLEDQYWIASGRASFESDAARHFYLPERYTDPFGNETTLQYDGKYDLFIQSSTDALGNTSGIAMEQVTPTPTDPRTERPRFDYRVLAPIEMVDANGNRSEVAFDILGMVVASAVKGKGTEADDLIGFDDALLNPSAAAVQAFCINATMNEQTAKMWLGKASARFVYHFGEERDVQGVFIKWEGFPAGACGIVRERHASKVVLDPLRENPLQVSLECSDGTGNVLMKKVQAEPEHEGRPLRWIINGLTVLNNKGKPVRQYEPTFSADFGCELLQANGVFTTTYYDAAGRPIRVEMPDGTFSRVEFSPWHVKAFDANDTVKDSQWYRERLTRAERTSQTGTDEEEQRAANASPEEKRAARLAAAHADTPAQVHLDSLGREVVAIAHNRTNGVDDTYLTFTKLDVEGKPLWIRDARGHLVMQYIIPAKANHDPSNAMPADAVPCYDIAGNVLFQHSMDAGDRWMLMDATGKPMLAWDMNDNGVGTAQQQHRYRTEYDALHRPRAQWLTINADAPIMVERYEYRDANNPDGTPNSQLAQDKTANLLGQLVRQYESSGLIETIRRDFKGNVQEVRRTLIKDATVSVVDWQGNLAGKLETETYVQLTEYDALNRMARQENWHPLGGVGAVYKPTYSERGALKSETFTLRGTLTNAIEDIRYNAKGQKEYLELGNGTLALYDYDERTFRLKQIRTTRPADASDFPDRHSNLQDISIIQQLHYTYDPVGNITEIYDEAFKPVFFANVMVEPRSRYEYDALYRLISATGRENSIPIDAPGKFDRQEDFGFPVQDVNALRNYTQRYEYDRVGNIHQMRHLVTSATGAWTRNYDYAFNDPAQPASNRLWRTWEHAPDWNNTGASNKVTYGYDTHGNMLNLANVSPGQQLQWDYRDMIKNLDGIGGGVAYYQYDSGKQRTRKRIVNQNGGGYWERIYLGGYERYRRYNGGSTAPVEEIESHHLFEGEQRVLLVDDVITSSKGTPHARPDGLTVKAQTLFRYQYSNHLGSACLELDHEAAIISYEEYHPYGTSAYRARTRHSEAPAKRYRYTGMERDEESGLGYHVARHFATWLARWTACDPAGLADGVVRYCYAKNNPVSRSDAAGRQSTSVTNPALEEGQIDLKWHMAFIRQVDQMLPDEQTPTTAVEKAVDVDIDTEQHSRAVVEIINLAISIAATSAREKGQELTEYELLRNALFDQVTHYRNIDAAHAQNLILRDVDHYLTGRIQKWRSFLFTRQKNDDPGPTKDERTVLLGNLAAEEYDDRKRKGFSAAKDPAAPNAMSGLEETSKPVSAPGGRFWAWLGGQHLLERGDPARTADAATLRITEQDVSSRRSEGQIAAGIFGTVHRMIQDQIRLFWDAPGRWLNQWREARLVFDILPEYFKAQLRQWHTAAKQLKPYFGF